MKKVLGIIFFILCLWPAMGAAKSSPLTEVENAITAVEGAMQKATETYVTISQEIQTLKTKAQEMADTVTKVKDEAQKFKKSVETDVNNLAAGGIGATMDGNEPTADMQEKIEENYVNDEVKKDVEATEKYDERNNEEMIHNMSAMYARGLVRRYKLQQEGADLQAELEEQKDDESIPDVLEKVNTVRMRGAARWINVMQMKANQLEQDAMVQLVVQNATTPPESEETGADKGE